ncbi:MAG: redoxin domain-containing protein [Bacteroidetes bacterium]|nr:MAG: redoxin domain-containing protein [Bacteroidota bacterium]
MKRILYILVLILTVSGCKDKGTFSVDGIIKDNTRKYIYIDKVDINTPVFIDSSKISKKGKFKIKVKASEVDFYQVGFSTNDFITLLAEPGEKIKLEFDGKNLFENYSVTGSVGSEKLQIIDKTLTETKRKLDSLNTVYEKASAEPGFDVKGPALEAEYSGLIREQRKKNIEFILNNINSLASIKALYQRINPDTYVLYDPKDLQYLKIVTDSLTHHFPNSKHVKALGRAFEKEMNQLYANKIMKIAKDMPDTKLDPDLKDIAGKRILLSSLKGKYILLTFWSVRSKECIQENLQLKEFYKIYNKKGFEIYQVNLDESETVWKSAVKFDELPWISTREDDPLNPKNAILFNVKSLPSNYLFDRDGIIISSNLHGRSLQLKLDQLFNK